MSDVGALGTVGYHALKAGGAVSGQRGRARENDGRSRLGLSCQAEMEWAACECHRGRVSIS